MSLSSSFKQFISGLATTQKNIYKNILENLLLQVQAGIKVLDITQYPIKIKIATYEPYVISLRTLYGSTRQAISPVVQLWNLSNSGNSGGNKAVTTRIPEFGIVNTALDKATLPLYKKLSKAEDKLRSLKLQKEQLEADKVRLQSQYDSIQEQINSM